MKLLIGTILTTHGLKGELKIRSNSDFISERFKPGNTVTISLNKESLDLQVATHRHHKGNELVSFVGYQDINLVERFKGWKVYGEKDESLLEEDEYYYGDLIGCEIIDEQEEKIGKVTSIIDNGVQDVLVVKKISGGQCKIPYVDAFIVDVDIDKKVIMVHVIEGLI